MVFSQQLDFPPWVGAIGFALLAITFVFGWVADRQIGFRVRWFTRQEERRLMTLLDDPADYERYRKRVSTLLPWFKPSRTQKL